MDSVDAARRCLLVPNLLELTHQLELWYMCALQGSGEPCTGLIKKKAPRNPSDGVPSAPKS